LGYSVLHEGQACRVEVEMVKGPGTFEEQSELERVASPDDLVWSSCAQSYFGGVLNLNERHRSRSCAVSWMQLPGGVAGFRYLRYSEQVGGGGPSLSG
jgi:hypothetical protein